MALSHGDRLGPYEIVRRLDAGGMGEVYRARDARLKRDVALKVLRPAQATPEHIQRLAHEARAAGSLNHPNILAVFDVGIEGAVPYIVSELLEGESLRHRLDRGPVPYRKALEYGVQIAHALAAANDKGICHRDVKPGNVFILTDGRVKLLDFGLAKLDTLSADSDDSTTSAISQAGRVCGTVGYMAPEQVVAGPVDHRTDIFALGAVLYEMLTGTRAFQRSSAAETMTAILREDPVNPLDLNPALPHAAAAAVRRCLEKNKEERFQSARDLAFHLQQLEQATTGVPPRAAPQPTVRRKLLWAGLALTALVAVTWLARIIIKSPPPPTFHQLTFLRGRMGGARFASRSVVYSQTLETDSPDVWLIMSPDNPESRRRIVSGADVLAARPDKLALSFRRRWLRGQRFVGTLAVEPVGGGRAPREVISQDDVEGADWDPSGEKLAVVRSPAIGETSRLEYPIGTTLYEGRGAIRDPRVSPDGQRVAFLEEPAGLGRGGRVVVVGLDRSRKELTQDWANARGLAWSPRGDEVWFTAADERADRALWAVNLKSNKRRLVLPAPVSLTIWDVTPDGKVLLTREDERVAVVGKPPGKAVERDFSLSNDTGLASLARDGSLLLLGDRSGAYLVPTDGSDPTALGLKDTYRDDLCADREHSQILATSLSRDSIVVASTEGLAAPQRLSIPGIDSYSNTRWFPGCRRILFHGRGPDRKHRSYVMDLPDGPPQPLTSEGIVAQSISPDGKQVAATGDGRISIWRVGDGAHTEVPGSLPGDRPEAWSDDGRWLWVIRRGEVPTYIYRLEIATGRRQPWQPLAPPDPAGVYTIVQFRITPSGNAYFYSYRRILSELYLVTGLP